jgi:hypothetical protein
MGGVARQAMLVHAQNALSYIQVEFTREHYPQFEGPDDVSSQKYCRVLKIGRD